MEACIGWGWWGVFFMWFSSDVKHHFAGRVNQSEAARFIRGIDNTQISIELLSYQSRWLCRQRLVWLQKREDERIVYHVMPTSGPLKNTTSAVGGRLLPRLSIVKKYSKVKWTSWHHSGGNTSSINSHWVAKCQPKLRMADGLVTKRTSSRQDTSP